ncbi:hypothetical protein OCGS_0397 [Oceaniovalibus guishaninsula JLT2003]|uniref:Integral membrane protein n=1 Tax=Oceaniovalibus guishaninsula JLT2003 TaxID=1231392 RepID=K2HFN5_9RHOB|nr:DUF2244 domain-containing protein [Oceaniovalibus guishaninsula]EKE45307.1 hypothetical protein OCGS_0397 [Oceaniovalibus guishaninsula JLT2003]
MPVEWLTPQKAPATTGAFSSADGEPRAQLRLWPHRSLPRRGFAAFILAFFCLILIPVLPLLGSPVLWGLLPFTMGAVWALWAALQRSYRDGELLEELTLWPDRIALVRHDPRRPDRTWEANPHWVSLTLHEKPVENYLTLRGAGREVELGAFLSPDERQELHDRLRDLLRG